ncbi:ATP-binding protein [Amycolatopsis sp. NBC_01480]|uniref:ATP-binding protein n=1 Tax=Amycolatopsis sp. NBC_01480 TaxID=2903562 RepID=UPI002E296915|nr:ATP-binding protein [Amycolatopsis sp. NBC_01480]
MAAPGPGADEAPWIMDLRGTGPAHLARIRGWARSSLTHLAPDHLEDVLMVTEELATNAYVHTDGPSWVRLTALSLPCLVVVEVDDSARLRPQVRRPDETSLRGRGMQLVDSLSDTWGVHENQVGKTVWARLGCGIPERPTCGAPPNS